MAFSLTLYSIKYLSANVQAACRTLHPDLKETEDWVMAQRFMFLKKLAEESPLADRTTAFPYVHYFMGGTHHARSLRNIRDLAFNLPQG